MSTSDDDFKATGTGLYGFPAEPNAHNVPFNYKRDLCAGRLIFPRFGISAASGVSWARLVAAMVFDPLRSGVCRRFGQIPGVAHAGTGASRRQIRRRL